MDFAETEDQKMIRGMVREFAEDVAGPTCNKRDKEQIAPIEEFKKFAELGFAGMTIPEKYGGQKLDDINEVQSHPMALLQCRDFFKRHQKIKLIEEKDTALVAKNIGKNRYI